MEKRTIISQEDYDVFMSANQLKNQDFAKTIMGIVEKYQILSNEDIEFLTNRDKCREQFFSNYAILWGINTEKSVSSQVKDNTGRNRYYLDKYQIGGKHYVMTSQLYGLGENPTHRDNRTPFWQWIGERITSEWWPSLEEYDPQISKSKWLELLNDGKTFTENAFIAIAALYDYGGIATCKQLEQKYGRSSDFYRATLSAQLASKVKGKLGLPYCEYDGKQYVWPILFQGKDATDEPGRYVWKMRPELYDALTEFGIEEYLKTESKEEMPATSKELVERVSSYIASKGFSFEDDLIKNFYLSLKSKPFVILAGTSGTGKTRLVKLFAEAIGAEYKMVPVRPDWSDSSDLFGHVNLNGEYVPGEILDFISEAQNDPERPFILCLDEMNLARVEYYFSDFLSVIETRDFKDGTIVSDPLVALEKYGTDDAAREKYGEIRFPQNLYIVGTVNMDETTFPFSKKVLDRANTIEFNYVKLDVFEAALEACEPLYVTNDFLKTDFLLMAQCLEDGEDRKVVEEAVAELQSINEKLKAANAHIGYRVRDEIVFYMVNNKRADLFKFEKAFDNEIMQKILPRIQGSATAIKNMLIELFKYCMGNYSGLDTETGNLGQQMQSMADSAKYPKSANKISYMMTRYEEDGFTSYWL